jgi:UDP-N-acetylmuramate--alanine ligase
MFRKARRLHFVGIGGTGMSGIAEVLVNMGFVVSGSDLAEGEATRRLARLGAAVHRGHAAGQVGAADVVVVSSAVGRDNPEVVEARRRGIPVIPRARMLAELMRLKYGVAVAGAHGKTTITAMIAEVLSRGGLDPTVVIGGRVGHLASGAKLGHGDFLVAEADESDGSFLEMKPTIAVVANIDLEHLDHWRGGLVEIQQAFATFMGLVPFYGAVVGCLDDAHVRAVLPRIERKTITYGLLSDAQVRASDVALDGFHARFAVTAWGEPRGAIELAVPGRHSVQNALAAIAVGLELDLPWRAIADALAAFRGVDRRLQLLGQVDGVRVIDDYGHHPTEIRATLAAVREGFGARTIVVFQPHRYSRTEALLEEFGASFTQADAVIVTEVYPAGEPPRPGVDGRRVAEALRRHGHPLVHSEARLDDVPARVRELMRPGDIVLTLGAGDVWRVGQALVHEERREEGDS